MSCLTRPTKWSKVVRPSCDEPGSLTLFLSHLPRPFRRPYRPRRLCSFTLAIDINSRDAAWPPFAPSLSVNSKQERLAMTSRTVASRPAYASLPTGSDATFECGALVLTSFSLADSNSTSWTTMPRCYLRTVHTPPLKHKEYTRAWAGRDEHGPHRCGQKLGSQPPTRS
jgi:hypothetical protein